MISDFSARFEFPVVWPEGCLQAVNSAPAISIDAIDIVVLRCIVSPLLLQGTHCWESVFPESRRVCVPFSNSQVKGVLHPGNSDLVKGRSSVARAVGYEKPIVVALQTVVAGGGGIDAHRNTDCIEPTVGRPAARAVTKDRRGCVASGCEISSEGAVVESTVVAPVAIVNAIDSPAILCGCSRGHDAIKLFGAGS